MQKPMGRWSSFCAMVLTLANLLACPSVARPPASDVQGLYENTRDDRKQYSPLWGMLALEGDLVRGPRFYGAYGILSRDTELAERQRSLMHPAVRSAMDRHELKITEILKEHQKQTRPEAIGHIEGLHKDLKEKTAPLKKALAQQPSGSQDPQLLAQLDAFKLEKTKLDDQLEILEEHFDDIPHDAIAGWLQALFPSPQFMLMIPNTRIRDPLGDLMKEKNLETLNQILEAIIVLRERPQSETKVRAFIRLAFGDFMKKCLKNYKGRDKIEIGQDGYSEKQQMDFMDEVDRLIDVLIAAIKEEHQLANPQDPSNQIYPDNIVMISLLAFVWERLDSAAPLYQLRSLMKIGAAKPSTPPWTKQTYETAKASLIPPNKPNRSYNLEDLAFMLSSYDVYDRIVPTLPIYRGGVKATNYKGCPNFYDCGENSLLSFFLVILNQQGGIDISRLESIAEQFRDPTVVPQAPPPSTPRDGMEGKIVAPPLSQGTPAALGKLLDFWQYKVSSVPETQLQSIHNDWANVVSNLNVENDPIPIKYVLNGKFEIDGGVYNMLNVIGHLIPDQILRTPWRHSPEQSQKLQETNEDYRHKLGELRTRNNQPTEKITSIQKLAALNENYILKVVETEEEYQARLAAIKFDRICELFSRPGFVLTWGDSDTEEDEKGATVPNEAKITFSINGNEAFKWKMSLQHFEIKPLEKVARESWKKRIDQENILRSSPYLQARFIDTLDQNRLPVTLSLYHPNNRAVDGAIQLANNLLKNTSQVYYPVLGRTLSKTIPLYDRGPGQKLVNLMASHHMNPFFLSYWPGLIQPEENRELKTEALLKLYTTKFMEEQALEFMKKNDVDPTNETLLNKIASYGHIKVAQYLVNRGANFNGTPPFDKIPLLSATKFNRLPFVQYLLETLKVDLNRQDSKGETVLHYGALGNSRETVVYLLQNGALQSINSQSSDGDTPLHLAAKSDIDNTDLIKTLLANGALLQIQNKKEKTPLQIAMEKGNLKFIETVLTSLIQVNPDVISQGLSSAKFNLNKYSAEYIHAFLAIRDTAKVIRGITFSGGNIKDILAICAKLPNLTSLTISGNNIGYAGAAAIANSQYVTKLTSLDLGSNDISAEGAQALASSQLMSHLTSLNLRNNKIGHFGAIAIANSPNIANLTFLNLETNQISDEGTQALANSQYVTKLTSLDLGRNSISAAGAQALANSQHLSHLTSLKLRSNQISDEGAQAIVNSQYLLHLTSLDLGYNGISPAGTDSIVKSQLMSHLISLNLGGNNIGNAGVLFIVSSQYLLHLTYLNLESSNIGDATQSALQKVFGDRVFFG